MEGTVPFREIGLVLKTVEKRPMVLSECLIWVGRVSSSPRGPRRRSALAISSSGLRTNSGNIQTHSVKSLARCHVKRLPISIAPVTVRRHLGGLDGSQVLAVGRENPDAAGTGSIEVSLRIHLQTVRQTVLLFFRYVEKHASLRQRSVESNIVSHPEILLRIRI